MSFAKFFAFIKAFFTTKARKPRRTWPCVSDGDFRARNARSRADSYTWRRARAARR